MATEARIRANQANAEALQRADHSPEGKERSRRNSLKHGLTGAGIVLPEADAAEVERRAAVYAEEMEAVGEVETDLARIAALNAVRIERGADQQTAALTERVRKVEAEFVAPEGSSEAEAAKLRDEAVRRAMFDPSKEATLARKYVAAAERSYFRALKELRQVQKTYGVPEEETKAESEAEVLREGLASFLSLQATNGEFDAMYARMVAEDPSLADPMPAWPSSAPFPPRFQPAGGAFDVPFAIGKPR